MDPKDFSWTEEQQVTVSNPTTKPYKFQVHGKEYEVGAGKTVRMAGFIAWVYVYGLAQTMAVEDDTFSRWNEEGYRKKYYEKLTVGVDNLIQAVEVEPEPQIEEVDVAEDPEPGQGSNYEPSAEVTTEAKHRGRPTRV